MIQKREMTVSNARMIAPVLTFENQDRWLSAAAGLSKRDLEKEIAKSNPELVGQERAKFVAQDRLELKFGVSEALHNKLKHVQDLVSSQLGEAADLEKTLEALVDLYIEKKDPVEKAKRSQARKTQPVPGQVKVHNPRHVPASLEHAVRLRDQGRCTQKNVNGQRCDERRWLDIHHVTP